MLNCPTDVTVLLDGLPDLRPDPVFEFLSLGGPDQRPQRAQEILPLKSLDPLECDIKEIRGRFPRHRQQQRTGGARFWNLDPPGELETNMRPRLDVVIPYCALDYVILRRNLPGRYFDACGEQGWREVGLIPYAPKEVQDAIERDARSYTPPVNRTRHMAGYGAVVLETSPEGNLMQRAGVTCAYGPQIAEHQHKDGGCNYTFFAKGIIMSPEFGWPPKTTAPDRHNLMQIDDWIAYNGLGKCLGVVEGQGVHFAEMDGVAFQSPDRVSSMIRRSLALAEVGSSDCYLVDVVRTRGGRTKHSYHFHSTFGDLTANVPLQPVPGDPEMHSKGGAPGEVVVTWAFSRRRVWVLSRNRRRSRCLAFDG